MRQQVNLYTAELRPRRQRLNAISASFVVVLVALVVGGLAVSGRYYNEQLDRRVQLVERQVTQLERVVAQLQERVQARQPDPELEAALIRVTDTIARRQRLLGRIETLATSGESGFSGKLTALARQVPSDLWLTEVRLESSPGMLAIDGQTRSAELVPHYLERLGEEPAFVGETFADFRIFRPDDAAGERYVTFQVATKKREDEGS